MLHRRAEAVKQMFGLLKPDEKKQFRFLLLLTLLAAFFQSVGVAAIFPFMNLVLRPEIAAENTYLSVLYSFLPFNTLNSFIVFSGVALLLLIVWGNLVSTYAMWYQHEFAWGISHRLSTELLHKYLTRPYSFHLVHNSSELSKNVLAEVNEITHHFLLPLLQVITRLTLATAILLLLLLVNPMITILAGIFIGGAYALILNYFRRQLAEKGRVRLNLNTARYKAVTEAMGGLKELKILGKEKYFLDLYAGISRQMSSLQAWQGIIGRIPRHLMEIVSFGGVVILTLVIFLHRGNVQQAIPLIGLFAMAGYRLMPALQEAFAALARIQFNTATVEKIRGDLLAAKEQDLHSAQKENAGRQSLQKGITLDGISFIYPGCEEKVLQGISMTIPKNTSVGIVGETGSGKTTLADILLGLLPPTEGFLRVDGTVITRGNLQNWQSNLGYVPQQIYLSDNTVARNIAFGVEEEQIDYRAVERAAGIANIHTFIKEKLPQGYGTVIGENGLRLSGGQRQRIGLARALYRNPEVLVLDEATSSLDGVTEHAVMDAIDNIAGRKTLIIIAHRLATIRGCDNIYLLEQGKIEASGNYRELLESSARFRAMERKT